MARADIDCTDCVQYLSKGMDYRIKKSRNFIRQAKRIEAKVKLLCAYSISNWSIQIESNENFSVNKSSKISNITASNTVLKTTIFGYKMNESDPQ